MTATQKKFTVYRQRNPEPIGSKKWDDGVEIQWHRAVLEKVGEANTWAEAKQMVCRPIVEHNVLVKRH